MVMLVKMSELSASRQLDRTMLAVLPGPVQVVKTLGSPSQAELLTMCFVESHLLAVNRKLQEAEKEEL
jgi:hypothetical protein